MRPDPVRVVALLVFLVLATGAAIAQDDVPPAGGNETAGGDEPAANDTAGNETGTDADAGAGDEPAAADCPTSWTLDGTASNVWIVDGRTNPRINVCPNAAATFSITISGGVHNFVIEAPDAPPVTSALSEGDSTTYEWQTPESGSFTYICKIHEQTMKGTVTVGEAAAGGGGGETTDGGEDVGPINGPAVQLKQIAGDAPCDKAVPAVVTRDTVGGPTVADYVDSCVRTAESDGPEKHAADVVIPFSFAAIAVGLLGVVWVHKYYKP